MKCDDVLSALATGGPLRRRRATRHAARCSRCRETAAFLAEVSDGLSTAPNLAPAERAAWLRAAGEVTTMGPALRRTRRLAAGAVAAVAAAAVVIAILPALRRPEHGGPRITRVEPPITSRPPGPAQLVPNASAVRQLDAMQEKLDSVEAELAELAARAELLDARRDADALWARYAVASRSRTL